MDLGRKSGFIWYQLDDSPKKCRSSFQLASTPELSQIMSCKLIIRAKLISNWNLFEMKILKKITHPFISNVLAWPGPAAFIIDQIDSFVAQNRLFNLPHKYLMVMKYLLPARPGSVRPVVFGKTDTNKRPHK